MILFTSGFPSSGKTELANKIIEKLDKQLVIHVDPKKYLPDEYDLLPTEEQSLVNITAWEMALEKVSECICKLPNKALVIFDTCCNKSSYMKPLFTKARSKGHHVFYVFIKSSLEDRKLRNSSLNFDDLEEKYASGFRETLPILKPLCNSFYVVNNPQGNLSEIEKSAGNIIKEIEDIRTNCYV